MTITNQTEYTPRFHDSGFEWLRSLPSHWKVRRFKFCGAIPNGQVDPRLPEFRSLLLIAPNHIESETGRLLFTETASDQGADSGKYIAQRGDVIYSKIRPELQKACISPERCLCSADMYPITPAADMVSKFILYNLLCDWFTKFAVLWSDRVAMPKVNRETLSNCLMVVPPVPEQLAIVAFLDHMTAQVDAVVAKKQRMIELLREERQALISRAVTQGLDASAPMKDSGVPWLPKGPTHWRIERLKFRMFGIEQGWSPQCDNQQAEVGEWGVLKVGCMNGGTYDETENKALPAAMEPAPELEVRVGDVLMSRSNTVELVGMAGIVHRTQGKILLCDKLYRIRFDSARMLPAYAVHLLRSHCSRLQIERDASGASPSMKNISNEVVANLHFAFPTLDEQQAICAHIDRETSLIDGLIEKNEQQIAKLREYRQTLISAAVTGKFTVPAEETPDFRAAVLAAEIIYSHPATKPIGRTKLHKELYATEHECDLVGIDADYARMPFGPYDDRLQKAVERELEARQWYRAVPGERGKVNYVPLAQAGQHRAYFDRFYGDKAEAIARLVGLLRPLNKNKIERAITLYAAWNDFLIRGEPVDDERLLTEVQKNWHPEKQHKEESWRESLGWLKARKLIPHGFGKPTRPTNVLTGLTTAPEDDAGEADEAE